MGGVTYSIYFHVGMRHLMYTEESDTKFNVCSGITSKELFELCPDLPEKYKKNIVEVESKLIQQKIVDML